MSLLLIFCATSVVGCDGDQQSDERPARMDRGERADEESAVPVQVDAVRRADVRRFLTATTSVSAVEEIQVTPLITGTVVDWMFDEGDQVRRGDVLARIEVPELAPQLAEADSSYRVAEREVQEARSLLDAGYLARRDFDELQQRLEAARSARAQLAEQASRQTLTSPIDGVVTERLIERGENATAGAPVYVVSDLSRLEAVVSIPERDLRDIREGMPAELEVLAVSSEPFAAQVVRISPTIDRTSGTADLRVAFDTQPEGVRAGMFATVRIPVETREGVPVVPARAVLESGGRFSVFVVDGEPPVARSLAIEQGLREGNVVQIVGDVSVGDRIVTVGQSRLMDGATVRIAESSAAQPPSEPESDETNTTESP